MQVAPSPAPGTPEFAVRAPTGAGSWRPAWASDTVSETSSAAVSALALRPGRCRRASKGHCERRWWLEKRGRQAGPSSPSRRSTRTLVPTGASAALTGGRGSWGTSGLSFSGTLPRVTPNFQGMTVSPVLGYTLWGQERTWALSAPWSLANQPGGDRMDISLWREERGRDGDCSWRGTELLMSHLPQNKERHFLSRVCLASPEVTLFWTRKT